MNDEAKFHVEKKALTYVFSSEENVSNGKKLAAANNEVERIEDAKKSAVSQYKSEIDAQKAFANMLNKKVAQGYETRDVECIVHFHTPEKGVKTFERTDIEEGDERMQKRWTEKMSETDWETYNDNYRDEECDVEFHVPDENKKTYTRESDGLQFIEGMSHDEKNRWRKECTVEFHVPSNGKKTYTHPESGKQLVADMQEEDIDLFNQDGKGVAPDAEEVPQTVADEAETANAGVDVFETPYPNDEEEQ